MSILRICRERPLIIAIHALLGLSAPVIWNDQARDHICYQLKLDEQNQLLSSALKSWDEEAIIELAARLFNGSPAYFEDDNGQIVAICFRTVPIKEIEKRIETAEEYQREHSQKSDFAELTRRCKASLKPIVLDSESGQILN
jgi:hypothetical protein